MRKAVPFGGDVRVEPAPLIAYYNLDPLSGAGGPHYSVSHASMLGHVVKRLPHRPDDRLGDWGRGVGVEFGGYQLDPKS